MPGWATTFAAACFGGLLPELLRWYQLRESPHFPVYSKSAIYWTLTALMIAAGGGLALLYGQGVKSPFIAANIGLSAPLIIKALADAKTGNAIAAQGPVAPGFSMGNGGQSASIANFLIWR